METQNSIFNSSGFLSPVCYSVYHQSNLFSSSQPPPPDDAFQMQHLRFPTPPITPSPPPSISIKASQFHVSPAQVRTKSVIMRVIQGLASPQTDDLKLNSQEPTTSSTSSTPSSEHVCDWHDCGRYFETLEFLAAHVTQVHAVASLTDGLYYCCWSGCIRTRGFNARYKMLVHVRTHTKEKPHQCQLCEKSFSRAENLKIHARSHSGEKPYTCPFEGCHKAYSNSSDRFKHTRTHSMEKPYKCKIQGCQKRYTDPSSLRKHVKTFKHAEQLIHDNAIGIHISHPIITPPSANLKPYHYATTETLPPTYHNCFGKPTNNISPTHATHYYMGMEPEDVCHIKATQLECYYTAADSPRAVEYWISNGAVDTTAYQSGNGCEIHRNEFSMDVETPLDLRVNRR